MVSFVNIWVTITPSISIYVNIVRIDTQFKKKLRLEKLFFLSHRGIAFEAKKL